MRAFHSNENYHLVYNASFFRPKKRGNRGRMGACSAVIWVKNSHLNSTPLYRGNNLSVELDSLRRRIVVESNNSVHKIRLLWPQKAIMGSIIKRCLSSSWFCLLSGAQKIRRSSAEVKNETAICKKEIRLNYLQRRKSFSIYIHY